MRQLPAVLLLLAACTPGSDTARRDRELDSAAAVSSDTSTADRADQGIVMDSNVTWDRLVSMVTKNPDSVLAVRQTHQRAVSVMLRNGRRYNATEPTMDAIIRLLKDVDPAGRILIATE